MLKYGYLDGTNSKNRNLIYVDITGRVDMYVGTIAIMVFKRPIINDYGVSDFDTGVLLKCFKRKKDAKTACFNNEFVASASVLLDQARQEYNLPNINIPAHGREVPNCIEN